MAKKKNKPTHITEQKAQKTQTQQVQQKTQEHLQTAQKEQQTGQKKLPKWLRRAAIPAVCIVFIMAMSFVFLYQKNSDALFMAQLQSLFNDTTAFFSSCMSAPGGLLQWLGTWFMQLFYNPGVGISVLTMIWIATFLLLKKAFRVPSEASALILVPITALLISEIDLGYWTYIMKLPGYYFRESLGVMALASLVWLARADRWSLAGSIATALAYPLIGFYAPLAALCIALSNLVGRKWIGGAIAAVAAIVPPLIWHRMYTDVVIDNWYSVGFPHFEWNVFIDKSPVVPFQIMTVGLIVLALIPGYGLLKKKAFVPVALTVALLAGCWYTTGKMQYEDENFTAECRAYVDAEEQQWDDLLTTVAGVKGNITRELIILKNIALFETGDAGNSMYHYDDLGIRPNGPDTLKLPMAELATPLIMLYHGKTNFAYRWAMENSVEYGYNITRLKTMTLAALINEEPVLAEKYLNILSHTMHYADWAEKYRPALANPKKIREYPELKHIIALYDFMNDRVDNDAGLAEKYLLNYFANSQCVDNDYVREVCMAYAMMTKDIQTFWTQFNLYAQFLKDKPMPIHYQEAAFLYGQLEPQTMDISQMPFDKEKIIDRYAKFNARTQQLARTGMSSEAIGEQTRTEFGDTFWWTYFFNRNSQYY